MDRTIWLSSKDNKEITVLELRYHQTWSMVQSRMYQNLFVASHDLSYKTFTPSKVVQWDNIKNRVRKIIRTRNVTFNQEEKTQQTTTLKHPLGSLKRGACLLQRLLKCLPQFHLVVNPNFIWGTCLVKVFLIIESVQGLISPFECPVCLRILCNCMLISHCYQMRGGGSCRWLILNVPFPFRQAFS